MEFSRRLMTLIERVPKGARVADIGSDHGLLPVYLTRADIASRCIAVDRRPSPLAETRKRVVAARVADRVSVRLGDGLDPIEPGEVEVVCIAGMGAGAICRILERGAARLDGVAMLLLQPNVNADVTRRWLLEHGWRLDDEVVVVERDVMYVTLQARPGDAETPYRAAAAIAPREVLIKAGPQLVQRPCAAQRTFWGGELARLGEVVVRLRGLQAQAQDASVGLSARIETLERERACVARVVEVLGDA